ncbi:MAG: ISAzo13 family transposase [Gammaproteobacteria bacterium]
MDRDLRKATKQKYEQLAGRLTENTLRLWAAVEAMSLGRGGISLVAGATGLSRTTIHAGIKEIEQPMGKGRSALDPTRFRIRRPGGGRKPLTEQQPELLAELERLVGPLTRGDPRSPLRWTCKSTPRLAAELQRGGYPVSQRTVCALLGSLGYSLQSVRKSREGAQHPDRDAQFQHIARQVAEFLRAGQPVISVDTKKKELVGDFTRAGQEWQPKGRPEAVQVHDFPDPQLGKVAPYGVYDLGANQGWVSVGVTHDTAEFAVESIRRWWRQMGQSVYRQARQLLITADCGGSNGSRVRLWKVQLQRLADELGLQISVCHFPPGTSKWNKIEHRMFCHITQNWRGRPLVSHEVIIDLIGATTTQSGLKIQAALDERPYAKGIKVSNDELAAVQLTPGEFHGEWNYRIHPTPPR